MQFEAKHVGVGNFTISYLRVGNYNVLKL